MWLNKVAEGYQEEENAVVDAQRLSAAVAILRSIPDYPEDAKLAAMRIQEAAEKSPMKLSQLRQLDAEVAKRYEEHRAEQETEAGPYHKSVEFELGDGYTGKITQQATGHYVTVITDISGDIVYHTNSIAGPPSSTIEELQAATIEGWPDTLVQIQDNSKFNEGVTMEKALWEDYRRDPDNSAIKQPSYNETKGQQVEKKADVHAINMPVLKQLVIEHIDKMLPESELVDNPYVSRVEVEEAKQGVQSSNTIGEIRQVMEKLFAGEVDDDLDSLIQQS